MAEDLTRAFIAIEFPDEVIKEVARVQEIIRNLKFTGKLTELENLHLTLKFLGEIEQDKLKRIKERLRQIKFKEMELKLGKVGFFNFRGRPRIVWIKIFGKGIFELQKKIDEALEKEGIKNEERFMGHITIARIKYVNDKEGFGNYINRIKLKEVKFSVDGFSLKKSELRTVGPFYSNIEIYKGESDK